MNVEWYCLIKCKGSSLTSVVVYGPKDEIETRATAARTQGDIVEEIGPSNRTYVPMS